MNFDKPLRQGLTIYDYVIINFKVDMEIELELRVKKEVLNEINPDLEENMEGKYFEIFSKLFKCVSGINIIIPGDFRTSKNTNCIKCSIGAKQGNLFFLKNSLLFIPKPINHIKYKMILRIELRRVSDNMSNRNFDFEVIIKTGDKLMLSGVDKNESENILAFFKSKKIMVTHIKEETNEDNEGGYDDDNSLDDEGNQYVKGDFIANDEEENEDEDEDDDFDPTKVK